MGDKEQVNLTWYDDAITYVNKIHDIKNRFTEFSADVKRDIFEFLFFNPTLTNGKLLTSYNKPTNLVVDFKNKHQLTLTKVFTLDKAKNRLKESVLNEWRTGRDSNPRPLP